jgi:predicted alpha/beta-fold hydrolase
MRYPFLPPAYPARSAFNRYTLSWNRRPLSGHYGSPFSVRPPTRHQPRGLGRFVPWGTVALLIVALTSGCFSERSFPLRSHDLVRVADENPGPSANLAASPAPQSTRAWLREVHARLQPLLPRQDRPTLLTERMTDPAGRPIDVYRFFDRDIDKMQGLFSNWWALQHTAQSIEKGYAIENAPALWPGFQSVWIPVAPGVELHGFLGFAERNGRPIEADCIVILPGLYGDNGAKRNRDVSCALRDSGFHVLSLELRGHGQVEAKYPQHYYHYGVLETQDLMNVSEWLQNNFPHVRETGLIGFCWGANQALLCAWYDGRSENDPSISPALARYLGPPSPRVHFAAGVMAFSPVLRWEEFLDRMETPKSVWTDPSPALFQESVKDRMRRKRFPEVSGNLRNCIAYEFESSGVLNHFALADGYQFLRLMDYKGYRAGDKLESARVPALIVHSVNDPLQNAQDVADFMALTSNPRVAAVILPGGGHIGLQAYCRAYFYSLIINFFDPKTGAAAGMPMERDTAIEVDDTGQRPSPMGADALNAPSAVHRPG